jgi:hypothetical protein
MGETRTGPASMKLHRILCTELDGALVDSVYPPLRKGVRYLGTGDDGQETDLDAQMLLQHIGFEIVNGPAHV